VTICCVVACLNSLFNGGFVVTTPNASLSLSSPPNHGYRWCAVQGCTATA
jgi:hypothetical protein